jgi:hypothetical protein
VVRYSFGVGLFHSFLDAGSSRRSRTTASNRHEPRPNGISLLIGQLAVDATQAGVGLGRVVSFASQ